MILPIDRLLFYIQKMLESEIESCIDELEAKKLLLEQVKKSRGTKPLL